MLQKVFKLLVIFDNKVSSPFQVMDEGTFAFDVRVAMGVVEKVGTVLRCPKATL